MEANFFFTKKDKPLDDNGWILKLFDLKFICTLLMYIIVLYHTNKEHAKNLL